MIFSLTAQRVWVRTGLFLGWLQMSLMVRVDSCSLGRGSKAGCAAVTLGRTLIEPAEGQ